MSAVGALGAAHGYKTDTQVLIFRCVDIAVVAATAAVAASPAQHTPQMPALLYNADIERQRFIGRWRHTVLPMVTKDPIFYAMLSLHIFLMVVQRELLAMDSELPPLNWKASAMVASLLTFFLVFYGGQCYTRYFQFYGSCVGLAAALGDWAYLVRAHFDAFSPAVKWNLLRLMLAALEIQFASLHGCDSAGAKGLTEAEWSVIGQHGLLGGEELARVQRYRGAKAFLPAVWALGEVRSALKAKLARIAPLVPKLPPSELSPPENKPLPKKASIMSDRNPYSCYDSTTNMALTYFVVRSSRCSGISLRGA